MHELRIKLSGDQIRVLYFFVYKDIILTHHFTKQTSKIPEKEIRTALKIKDSFTKRFKTIKHLSKYLEGKQ